jgi:hypothetical protein
MAIFDDVDREDPAKKRHPGDAEAESASCRQQGLPGTFGISFGLGNISADPTAGHRIFHMKRHFLRLLN